MSAKSAAEGHGASDVPVEGFFELSAASAAFFGTLPLLVSISDSYTSSGTRSMIPSQERT